MGEFLGFPVGCGERVRVRGDCQGRKQGFFTRISAYCVNGSREGAYRTLKGPADTGAGSIDTLPATADMHAGGARTRADAMRSGPRRTHTFAGSPRTQASEARTRPDAARTGEGGADMPAGKARIRADDAALSEGVAARGQVQRARGTERFASLSGDAAPNNFEGAAI